MEREGKDKEGERQKHEFERLKMRRGIVVRKRGSISTPPATWRFGLFQNDGSLLQESNSPSNKNTLLSARKLADNLWDIQPPLQMNQFKERSKLHGDSIHAGLVAKLDEPFQKIKSADVKGKGMKEHHHHQSVERNGGTLQASTLASYSSSMEMTPYRPTFVPSNPLKSKFEKPGFNLTTSTELIKVLNRIWSLEEQHASAKSLVKALKRELHHSQERIHELQLEKKRDQDDLVQSIKEELVNERRLRKQSETLHRKLGRQLSEVNSGYANALRALERERNARFLLEELCDEFAEAVKEYDQETLLLKKKNKNEDHINAGRHNIDGLILHLSEAWLDERIQMKRSDSPAKQKTISEKLSCEIKTLLQTKRNLKPECAAEKMHAEEASKMVVRSKLEARLQESRNNCRKQQINVKYTEGLSEKMPLENHCSQSMKISELIQNDAEQRKKKEVDSKNYYLQAILHRTNSVPVQSKQIQIEKRHAEYAFDPKNFTGPHSPVEKFTSAARSKVPEISEQLKESQSVKENTLQALLLDARLEAQQDL